MPDLQFRTRRPATRTASIASGLTGTDPRLGSGDERTANTRAAWFSLLRVRLSENHAHRWKYGNMQDGTELRGKFRRAVEHQGDAPVTQIENARGLLAAVGEDGISLGPRERNALPFSLLGLGRGCPG